MTQNGPTCQEGWELPELLAYVEGELAEYTSRDLERHLRVCPVCSSEVESLRKLDRLLRSYPESFHPGADELYRFVSTGSDSEAWISEHLASCSECREDVDLLRQMITVGAEAPGSRQALPASLVRSLEALHGLPVRGGLEKTLLSWLSGRCRSLVRPPVLALGTAAATLIVAILVIPLLTTFPRAPHPAGLPPVEESVSKADREEPFLEDQARPVDTTRSKVEDSGEKLQTDRYRTQYGGRIAVRDARKLEKETTRGEGEPEETTGRRTAPTRTMRKTGRMEKSPTRPVSPASMPAPPQQARDAAPAKVALSEKQSAATVPATPSAIQKSEIPVTVEILDSEGAVVPWLKFVVPQGLPEVFRFSDAPSVKSAEVTGKPSTERTHSVAAKEMAEEGLLIRFRVVASGAAFDVRAELFEHGAAQPRKTLAAAKVSREDLTSKISSMAASLLVDGSTGDELLKRRE